MAGIEITINGQRRRVNAREGARLLEVMRDAGFTGAKEGCGEGQCGSCTVLLNGKPVRACITPASSAAGKPVLTIEGLEQGGRLHPVQQAFLEAQAFQCGYCTPGMILAAAALIDTKPSPSEDDVRAGLQGHLCRCGTYPRIVEAVRLASRLLRQEGSRRG